MAPIHPPLVVIFGPLDFSLIGLEFSLVEIWEIDELLLTLLEVCPTHKDKIEIKCMGSIGGKTPTKLNFTYSSLILGTLNKMKLMLCALFNYNMGDKIRSVAFKYI
jgi:hypothetical protein